MVAHYSFPRRDLNARANNFNDANKESDESNLT